MLKLKSALVNFMLVKHYGLPVLLLKFLGRYGWSHVFLYILNSFDCAVNKKRSLH